MSPTLSVMSIAIISKVVISKVVISKVVISKVIISKVVISKDFISHSVPVLPTNGYTFKSFKIHLKLFHPNIIFRAKALRATERCSTGLLTSNNSLG
jgi:hypothetical protein